MLYLELTDGQTKMNALEYDSIAELSILTSIGCKILVLGPVQIRKRTFLLTSGNIQVLGGDVEELMAMNRPLQLLAKKLNKLLPEEKKKQETLNERVTYSTPVVK